MQRIVVSFLLLMAWHHAAAQGNRFVVAFLQAIHSSGVKDKASAAPDVQKLIKEKKLVAAGRFENGGGVFVFNSTSIEEVKAWLSSEASISAAHWKVEVLPFMLRTGSFCTAKPGGDLNDYQFIRYDANIAKFNIQEAPELFGKHDDYLKSIHKTGNTLAEGIFGDSDGGILIMKGSLEPAVIENDPAVREGLLESDVKKIYFAKGVLCEK